MSQPDWKYIANLGDATPLEHGGAFLYTDNTGAYSPELEILEEPPDDLDIDSPKARWTVYRFSVDQCSYKRGILSDNKYHPDKAAWFASDDKLDSLAESVGEDADELAQKFCSKDERVRAFAWMLVGQHWGYHELDHYPITLTRAEVEARYTDGELG